MKRFRRTWVEEGTVRGDDAHLACDTLPLPTQRGSVSSNVEPTEHSSGLPGWLQLGLIVIACSAGYTLLAYLLWLWTS